MGFFALRHLIEQTFLSRVPMVPSSETEYEFVDVGLQVHCPQAVVSTGLPRFEVGEMR